MAVKRRLLRLVLPAAAITVAGPAALAGTVPAVSGLARPLCVNAAAQHHATLVVEHADGSTVRAACVGFDGASVTGKQVLAASGIEYGFSSDPNYGDAVCQVDNEPSSYPPNCFALPDYWSIWQSGYKQPWKYATKGVDGVSLGDGDAIGFRYRPQSSPQPPTSAAGLCPAPQPTSSPTSRVTPPGTSPAPNSTGSGGSTSAPSTAVGSAGRSPARGLPEATNPGDQGAATVTTNSSPQAAGAARQSAASQARAKIPVSIGAAVLAAGAGVLAAAVAGVALAVMLIIQVLLPRLRL